MHIGKKRVLSYALICLMSSTMLLSREDAIFSEKNFTQAFGAYIGGLIGGTASFVVASELLDVAHRSHDDTRAALAGWVGCGALLSAYCGAKLFWYLTPDALIERSRSTIKQYSPVLESMVVENFYDNLNLVFVGSQMPLVAAFNYVKNARNNLTSRRDALNDLKKRNGAWKEEVDELLPRINRLLNIVDYSLVMITRHPDWAQCLAVEEMRLARLTPQVHYVCH